MPSMFAWVRDRRRRKLLEAPFPPYWETVLKRNVAHFARLPAAQQVAVRGITQVLVAERAWEGCGGLHVTPEMPVTIAAQAALLLLGDRHAYFARVPTVLVYPDAFVTPDPDDWEEDEVGGDILSGQATDRGPVVLSWAAVLEEGRDPSVGHNLVVHEFAHQLDYLDGDPNGTPPLPNAAARTRWHAVMQPALATHLDDLKATGESLFSPDAADEVEFFADACEAFFCSPHDLQADYPAVYGLLAGYFAVDAAGWFPDRHHPS